VKSLCPEDLTMGTYNKVMSITEKRKNKQKTPKENKRKNIFSSEVCSWMR